MRLRARMLTGAIAMIGLALASAAPASAASHTGKSPWWTNAVIYEVYTRSFQDSDGDGVGDLPGVTQRLDYLKALGVDAIWLTPFYPSPDRDFGYDISDYTAVGPHYGTMADFKELVRQARRRDIRVLVDLVLNHSSDQHPWFKDSRASRTSAHRDWYVWRDSAPGGGPPTHWPGIHGGITWSFDEKTGQWWYHAFAPEQPDLNWRNPQVRRAMFDVARFWLKAGASGFRLDATPYLFEDPAFPEDPAPTIGPPAWLKPYNSGRPETHAVLRDLRWIVDGFPDSQVLLGESATANIADLRAVYGRDGAEISLPMDFLVANVPRLDAQILKARYDEAQTQLDGLPPVVFFSNHDRSRQYTRFGDGVHDDAIARLTAALTLTQRGAALIYYGEELGLPDLPPEVLRAAPLGPTRARADSRDRARGPMPWSSAPSAGFTGGTPWLPVGPEAARRNVEVEQRDPASLLAWYTKLLKLRRDEPAFRTGAYVPLTTDNPRVFAFARMAAGGRGALMVFNCSDQTETAEISGWPAKAPVVGEAMLSSESVKASPRGAIALDPFAVGIFALGRS